MELLSYEGRDPAREGPDPTRLAAPVEQGSFLAEPRPPGETLTVAAYNLERGMHQGRQLALLRDHPTLRAADVVLLSEADRGCTRTGGAHVARDLARGLGMAWAFAVQYVELPRPPGRATNRIDTAGEHGNAILSRLPLRGVRALRHGVTANWRDDRREPRLGGSVTLRAEVGWAGAAVALYAIHFDSRLRADALRVSQAWDVVADAARHRGPVVIGGDTNAYLHTVDVWLGTGLDPTVGVLRRGGLSDAHAGLPPWRRGTTDRSYGVRGAIDMLWTRGLAVQAAGVVGPRDAGGLSDHLPVWASFEPEPRRRRPGR